MKCAYCQIEGKMSREHVMPKGFIKHMNDKKQITSLDKAPTRVIKGEVTVKDVCSTCNNGELSLLDEYALKLILKYNDQVSVNTKKIYFKYNYDMLTRWLLKVAYNSARANDSDFDVSLYKKNIDYIMNRGNAVSNIIVFAVFMGIGGLSNRIDEICYHLHQDREYEIDWFRIGPYRLNDEITFYCANRYIIINSFAFVTVVCDKENNDELTKIRNFISENEKNIAELSPSGKVWLKRDDEFFFKTIETNIDLRDSYMKKRVSKKDDKVKIIRLTREEIENENFTQFNCIKIAFMSNKDDLMDSYQSLIITIDGYENEEREPYQSKSLQHYFRRLFDEFPEIIWILMLDENEISLQVMIWAYINDNFTNDKNDNTTKIIPNEGRASDLVKKCFGAINELTNKYAFDFSRNQDLTSKFYRIYAKSIGIPNNMDNIEL